jgi:hypothetical protein
MMRPALGSGEGSVVVSEAGRNADGDDEYGERMPDSQHVFPPASPLRPMVEISPSPPAGWAASEHNVLAATQG